MEFTIWIVIAAYLIFHGALLWGAPTQADDNTNSTSIADDDIATSIGSSSSIWDDETSFLDSSSSFLDSSSSFLECNHSINPANGLPMIGCVDIEGNPYGTDLHSSWDVSSCMTSSFDDSFSSISCDDSLSSSSFSTSSFDD